MTLRDYVACLVLMIAFEAGLAALVAGAWVVTH